jgi:endonuclease/exonuclease/phosphatase (EEP) superfamily protein YafD
MARTVVAVIAGLALVVAAAAFTARFVPNVNRTVLVTAALAPYLMLGAPLGMILFATIRSWTFGFLGAALTIAMVAVQLPWWVGGEAAAAGLRIMSANLRYGLADPDALVHLANEHADILAVQELTPEEADRLSAAGIDRTFPYRALRAREGPAGVGIWSRYPTQHGAEYDEFWLGLLTARIRIPGADREATVVVTHLSAPWPDPVLGWRGDMSRLAVTLKEIGTSAPGPVLVAGDLNATPDLLEFRRLLRNGYRDAAEQAGAGLIRTHPADLRVIPALFALDHILTRHCEAVSVNTVALPDSDHRALVVTVAHF